MSFTWKDHKSIWKGEGIYFITFTIVGRQKLLGSLVPLSESRFYQESVQRSPDTNRKHTSTLATVNLTPLGFSTSSDLTNLKNLVPGLVLCAKQIMPDHLHAVVWITKDTGRSIRENHHPLVIMLLDGFPPEGTDAARYYHPDGIYHRICNEGKLLLLSPHPSNYDNPHLINLTDQELERKATEKGIHYTPIPHTSKRWRMIAGNVMLRMIAEG